MKKFTLLTIVFAIGCSFFAEAQFTKYVIKLRHKGDNPFSISNPSQYLTPRAIARRARYNIPIDSLDLPITPRFIDSIRLAGAVTILNTSKWLNQVAIQTNDAAALAKINGFPFVQAATPIAPFSATSNQPVNKKLAVEINNNPITPTNNVVEGTSDIYTYGASNGQVKLHNGQFLHNRGYSGQGMQMAVMDAGFVNYLTLPTFDSVRNAGQILGTWDYVNNNANVNGFHSHGTQCFSTIAANMPGVFMGTAPKTSFYLYRTEDAATEYPVEEQNWAAAAERADSLGADVFSVSLGYFTFDNAIFNYTYANMNGNTTMIARAADVAAKKGILGVFANGNEGNSAWRFLISPADADSVLAVGAVNVNGVVGGFSSYGPSSDGQIKPGVAAVGVSATIVNTNTGQPASGSGTSFACPNMAGLTTCLWQAFPEENNMSIINALQQSANRATNPDDRTGYGIPNMLKAFSYIIKQRYTQSISVNSCKTNIQFNVKTDTGIVVYVERKLASETNYSIVSTHTTTGAFARRTFNYIDDLAAAPSGNITYRMRMKISTDTTFYLDSATVSFIAKPALGADKAAAICTGESYNLSAQYNTTGLSANWTIGGNPVANPAAVNASGTYQLIVTNPSGCNDTAVIVLTVNNKPNLGADKAQIFCSNGVFDLTTLFTTTGLTATWSLNGNTIANPALVTAAGNYRLIATNGNCSDTAFANLTHFPEPCYTPVTEKVTLSPNPVSDNLTLLIARNSDINFEVLVHNTLGQRVYVLNKQQAKGAYTTLIPMSNKQKGIYYVTIKIDGKEIMVKKILKK
ncbi:MAG: S8 family peptidase [Ferruginibacter sp.]|nr:S8 family peptidase [Ferruginibacter sp.]